MAQKPFSRYTNTTDKEDIVWFSQKGETNTGFYYLFSMDKRPDNPENIIIDLGEEL